LLFFNGTLLVIIDFSSRNENSAQYRGDLRVQIFFQMSHVVFWVYQTADEILWCECTKGE
jgi:hypothetical protein